MSREFCLRQTKKDDLIKIILSRDEIIDSFNKDISGELLMRNIAALQSENEKLKEMAGLKMTSPWQKLMNAVKPVKFEPPMWEDLQHFIDYVKSGTETSVRVHEVINFICAELEYGVYLTKSEGECSIEITKDSSVYRSFELSVEGYFDAISLARKIFMGEE